MTMIVISRLLRSAVLSLLVAMSWPGGIPTAFGAVDNISYQGSFPASTVSGMTRATLSINGNQRDLLIYRPSATQSLPLMIYFDGTGTDLTAILNGDYSWLRDFADTANTIIAVPAQRVMSYGDWDNHSAGTPYFETAVGDSISSPASSNPDTNPDLLFTRAIIKEASLAYGADLTRVYVNGFSNGAFFSYFVAATLNDKIAAFAETGGGLAMSNTTYGEPTPCTPIALPGATGAVRSCAGAGWSVGLCSASGAMARPIAPTSVTRVPPGFMEANDDDDTVPFAHTCNLANALPVSSDYQVRIVHSNGIKHAANADYFNNSWNFLKNYRIKASQTIGTINFSPTTLAVSGTTTASATATSGLAVSFSSMTPDVCAVSGSTITGIAAGTCSIAGNQAGNGNFAVANQTTQNITVNTTSDCLFNWAEKTYAQFFTPAGAPSANYAPYYYRYYSGTGNYLGISSADNHIWVLGPGFGKDLLDVGPTKTYLTMAGCSK